MSSDGGGLYLGIDLSVEALRAVVLNDGLDLVRVEGIDFDREFREYG